MDCLCCCGCFSWGGKCLVRQIPYGSGRARRTRNEQTCSPGMVQLLPNAYDGRCAYGCMVSAPQRGRQVPFQLGYSRYLGISYGSRFPLFLCLVVPRSYDFHCVDGKARQCDSFVPFWGVDVPRAQPALKGRGFDIGAAGNGVPVDRCRVKFACSSQPDSGKLIRFTKNQWRDYFMCVCFR